MLLPLQGESAVVYSSPRAPLRSALGYEQVAPSGRTDGIIPPTISSQPNWFFRAKIHLSSYHSAHVAPPCKEAIRGLGQEAAEVGCGVFNLRW